jgi:hypothetical protein
MLLNFAPLILPVVLYFALWRKSLVAMLLLAVCALDLVLPLRIPGLWMAWCKFASVVDGKLSYFPSKVIIEEGANFDKKENYLFCCHPHSLYYIGYDLMADKIFKVRMLPC